MNKKKLITMVASLGLVIALGVGGTLALLSTQTQTLTNTFTVGAGLDDLDITLDEKNIATPDPDDRTTTGNKYTNLEPNTTLVKDPTVTISNHHAKCYVFVKVSGVDAMNAISDVTVNAFSTKLAKLDNTPGKDGLYVYAVNGTEATMLAENEPLTLVVFDGISLGVDADLYTNGAAKTLNNITIKACAVQAAGSEKVFEYAKAALPQGF